MDNLYIRLDVSINIIAAHSMFLLLILHTRFMMLDKYKGSCQPMLLASSLHFKSTKLAHCSHPDTFTSEIFSLFLLRRSVFVEDVVIFERS